MKILIVSQYYYPEQFQINEIAPELVKRGHDVTVLTGLPNYPKGEIYSGYENGQKRKETLSGVKVIRVEEQPRKSGAKNLFMNYLSFYKKGSKAVKKLENDFDVVFCYQLSPITMLKPAIDYAKKNKKPLLAYSLDIWPESVKDHMNIPVLYSAIAALSRRLYKACDHISVTSRPFLDYFEETIGFNRNKMSYIPQHADMSMLNIDLSASDNGIADFMYAGNMGKAQTLDVIIRAVAELKDRTDFVVHMVGDGSRKVELEVLSKELGVEDKVIFYGNQNREVMPEFYKKADALLITLRGHNAVGNTMPGKLQMYMATGKPVLGAINGAAREIITESECGKCVAAGDYKGLAAIMLDYIDNKENYSECGEKARKYFAENFTMKKYCDDMEKQLRRLVEADKYEDEKTNSWQSVVHGRK